MYSTRPILQTQFVRLAGVSSTADFVGLRINPLLAENSRLRLGAGGMFFGLVFFFFPSRKDYELFMGGIYNLGRDRYLGLRKLAICDLLLKVILYGCVFFLKAPHRGRTAKK